jgi:hypothetical protein
MNLKEEIKKTAVTEPIKQYGSGFHPNWNADFGGNSSSARLYMACNTQVTANGANNSIPVNKPLVTSRLAEETA